MQTDVKRPLIIAGIVIGLSLLLGLGGSYVLATQLSEKAQQVATARVASARAATLAPRIAALKAQEAPAAAYQRIITLLLPTQEQLLEIPRAIDQLGRARGVDARFQFLGSPDAGAVTPGSALPFSLTVSGAPGSITAFLRDLEIENPRYTIDVSSVEMVTGADNASRLNAQGSVFYQ